MIAFDYFKLLPDQRNKHLPAFDNFYSQVYIRKLASSRILIPGCGALGCENIKLLTLLKLS